MKDTILIGRGEKMHEVSAETWRKHLAGVRNHSGTRLSFMTDNHQMVRNFAVRELPGNQGKPLSPEDISQRLSLPLATVITILEDLERHLFFLVRNDAGEVSWAFPVTTDKTPHRLRFNSGEQLYAAGAEDAIATPFVQGRLRNERLWVEIVTQCAHCGQELHLTLDSELNWQVKEHEARPLLFEPDVDWAHLEAPNIIHDYGQNSVFFWSEEHARDFRTGQPLSQQQVDGIYMTLDQSAYAIKIAQSALFAFEEEGFHHKSGAG